jgi:hypothetical protein
MGHQRLFTELCERLDRLPILDAHTHLADGQLGAKGLHDILLYHMAISELYSAGCHSGGRLTQFPGWPSQAEAHHRLREALPYLAHVRNTSTSWAIRIILRELYGWDQPITKDNWERLDSIIRERSDDAAWHREILKRAGITRCVTEWARRDRGQGDDVLSYALEWGFFTRCQWGEYDTALYELERCWGRSPDTPCSIGGKRPATDRTIHDLGDVHAAIQWYVEQIPVEKVLSMATHLSTDIDYRVVNDDEMASALNRRPTADQRERDIYASYINEALLSAMEERHGDRIVFQFSLGAEPLPYETASRLEQRTVAQLATMISRHPGLQFQCLLSSAHANQAMCTLCRELPNLSLAGFWWHNFFPSIIERVFSERLDMLPLNRQIGFFSDAYCVEWAYAKARLVRRSMAKVMAERIVAGQFDVEEAVSIVGHLLHESAAALLRVPRRD